MSPQPDALPKPGGWRGRWLKPLAVAVAAILLALAAVLWHRTREIPLCDLALVVAVLLVVFVPARPAGRDPDQ